MPHVNFIALENKIEAVIVEKCQDITAENADNELPTLVKFAAGLSGIDVNELVGEKLAENAADVIANTLTAPIISIVSVILAFIILYFGSRILMTLIFAITATVADGGVVGFINKFLGFIFSALMMVIVCWCLTALFDFIVHTPALEGVSWAKDFTGGYIYEFFRTFSPIDLLLSF